MHVIKSIKIAGFRGKKDIGVDLHPDVNFFIGRNGTGKTTLISIIAAAIQGDFDKLVRLPFGSIKIFFNSVDKLFPILEIIRETEAPIPSLSLRLHDGRDTSPTTFKYERGYWFDEEFAIANPEAVRRTTLTRRIIHGMPVSAENRQIVQRLQRLVRSTWLTIHRGVLDGRSEDRGYDTTVDLKVRQLHDEFPKYFSLLDTTAHSEFRQFQETYFLSLLTGRRRSEQRHQLWFSFDEPDIETEKKSLEQIFSNLQMSPASFMRPMQEHFDYLKEAYQDLQRWNSNKNASPMDIDHFYALQDARRIQQVISEWNRYQEKRAEIYLPKFNFLKILNSLFEDKEVQINERNEPTIHLIDKEGVRTEIPLSTLSSGEKQMFILLGEALLEEQKPWVYIADEPELSLHMEWQERLVTNLREINPSGQVIFATHSPEILGPYGDRAFDMAKL